MEEETGGEKVLVRTPGKRKVMGKSTRKRREGQRQERRGREREREGGKESINGVFYPGTAILYEKEKDPLSSNRISLKTIALSTFIREHVPLKSVGLISEQTCLKMHWKK